MTLAGRGAILEISGLTVQFRQHGAWTTVVDDLDLTVPRGGTVGVVGESGSGKTITLMSILRLIDRLGGRITNGTVEFDGRDLLRAGPSEMRRVRGGDIGTIFQQPIGSLNPAFTIGAQVAETIRVHKHVSRSKAWETAIGLLDRVRLPNPRERAKQYPHQFSGGQAQRVMIALAMACEPKLILADEPTTALDNTVQAAILDLLLEVQRESGIAILLISHDLGVVARLCEDIAVMYAGQIVERGPATHLLECPHHPYTAGLLRSMPRLDGRLARLRAIPGMAAAASDHTAGCRFAPRCEFRVDEQCETRPVDLTAHGVAHVRCARTDLLDLGRWIHEPA